MSCQGGEKTTIWLVRLDNGAFTIPRSELKTSEFSVTEATWGASVVASLGAVLLVLRGRSGCFGPPKGSCLEGTWDPSYFREIAGLVKDYFIWPDGWIWCGVFCPGQWISG